MSQTLSHRPLMPEHGLWGQSAPEAPLTEALRSTVRADVAIVGAGYTGLSAALHLSQRGLKVSVIEAMEIGFGGAGRNVGLVNAGMWVMPEDLPKTLGPVYGERLLNLLGGAPALVFELVERFGIDCELQRQGTLHCASDAQGLAELQERARQWQDRGAPVHLLNAEEAAKKLGSRAYKAALLDMRAGTIQPLAYVRGLAKAALEAGAQIYTQSPVQMVEAEGQGAESKTAGGTAWRVKTQYGAVEAPWVIMATDAYTQGPWEIIRKEQVHLPYFNFATTPLPEAVRQTVLPEGQGAWDTKEVLSSFRMDARGRLIFGSVGALKGVGASVHRAWARRAMTKIYPQLKGFEFEQAWYGQIGMTDNNLPRFHKLAPQVIGFSGYNGRGIAPGTIMGRTLAEYICAERSEAELPLPVSEAQEPDFRSLKETFYEVGAQAVHLTEARF